MALHHRMLIRRDSRTMRTHFHFDGLLAIHTDTLVALRGSKSQLSIHSGKAMMLMFFHTLVTKTPRLSCDSPQTHDDV